MPSTMPVCCSVSSSNTVPCSASTPAFTFPELPGGADERDRAKTYGELKHPHDPGEGVIVVPTDNHTPESVRDHVYALMRETFPELPELE